MESLKLLIAFPAMGKTPLSKAIPGCIDLDFGYYRIAHQVAKEDEATLYPSFCSLIRLYCDDGQVVLTNEPGLLQTLEPDLLKQTYLLVPQKVSFAATKLGVTEDQVQEWVKDWEAFAHDAGVPVVHLDTDLLTCFFDDFILGQVSVPPKPSKKQVPESQYLDVLQGHHDAVAALLYRAGIYLCAKGVNHDIDKIQNWAAGIKQPTVPHRHQRHHWYAEDNETLPDLFDIIESCADTVATTAGKQSLDPWAQEWTPPQQDPQWWEDTILRTCNRFNAMLDYPVMNPKMPKDVPTHRERDD